MHADPHRLSSQTRQLSRDFQHPLLNVRYCDEAGLLDELNITKIDNETSIVKKAAVWFFNTTGSVVYVKILNGTIFASNAINIKFNNQWACLLNTQSNDDLQRIYDRSTCNAGYRLGTKIITKNEFRLNGYIVQMYPLIRNINDIPWWLDMLAETCKTCHFSDIEFLFNPKDFPRIPNQALDLSLSVWDTMLNGVDLKTICFSSCSSDRFMDVLFPTADDWTRCTTNEIGNTNYLNEIMSAWTQRKDVVVFRGSATGKGVCQRTNLRLKLCHMPKNLVDAKITKWPSTLRVIVNEMDETVTISDIIPNQHISTSEFMDLKTQAKRFKYTICLDGHVAAYRLGDLLSSGMLVFLPQSEWKLWLHAYILPWKHYVPVSSDLSDLEEKIMWARKNDDTVVNIIKRAHNILTHISSKEFLINKVALNIVSHSKLYTQCYNNIIRTDEKESIWVAQRILDSTLYRSSIDVEFKKRPSTWYELLKFINTKNIDLLHLEYESKLSTSKQVICLLKTWKLVREVYSEEEFQSALVNVKNIIASPFVHRPFVFKASRIFDESEHVPMFAVVREYLMGARLLDIFLRSKRKNFHDLGFVILALTNFLKNCNAVNIFFKIQTCRRNIECEESYKCCIEFSKKIFISNNQITKIPEAKIFDMGLEIVDKTRPDLHTKNQDFETVLKFVWSTITHRM